MNEKTLEIIRFLKENVIPVAFHSDSGFYFEDGGLVFDYDNHNSQRSF